MMKTKIPCIVVIGALLLSHEGYSEPSGATSSSASYELLHAPPGNPGGSGVVTGGSGAITAEVSLGDECEGVPGQVTEFGVLVKPNLVGQFYDPTDLEVFAIPAIVAERSTRQFAARAAMDDDTTLALAPDRVMWSEASDALAGISSAGLVTAASVYQDEVAAVHGIYQGIADLEGFNLTVLNTGADDFGTYAGDAIDDVWQIDWFGLPPNVEAAASADPDADQQDNLFEFLSGFSPVDPLARFELKIVAVNRVEQTADLQLNRVIPYRTYTLKASPDLATPFAVLGNLPAVEEPQTDMIIRDPSATAPRNFYIIGISKP